MDQRYFTKLAQAVLLGATWGLVKDLTQPLQATS